ncbi:MAG: hypothetical protein RJB10_1612 [Pseudomonadota bacterium]|jgi:hypothetical protein
MEKQKEIAKPTLKELLLSDSDRFDLDIPARGKLINRKTETAILFNAQHTETQKHNDSVSFAKPFLRLKLWLPPSIPLGIIFLGYIAVLNGHQFNIHGDFAGLVFLVLITSIVALVIGINNLPNTIRRLSKIQSDRTFVNYFCALYAAMFCTICLLLIVYAVVRIATEAIF